ncbi:MAG TPA: hypothetical protein VFO41_12420 [Alphaproteobacteria bacterium]|nr:hypothetical protein [Alphaproteobacteria bacterium]
MMQRLLPVAVVLLTACAGTDPSVGTRTADLDLPRFDDYPPFEEIAPEAIAVEFDSHAEASRYRTVLRAAAEAGRDFAGHLAVAEWGCGTNCQRYAFIDARDGRVIFGPTASHGAAYRADSRLFVVNPVANLPVTSPAGEVTVETEYWLWNGEALERIAVPG